ncbi:cytochrome c [Echinicola marina]|uniref:c-type cytochrome n=1 Tax=Echinicola marina TaxID=2859768 RepID=UPI001CF70EC1|nr:cytochrome c [Echinicola marina]UCS93472.1 cytochrome c [Echinicola marina]
MKKGLKLFYIGLFISLFIGGCQGNKQAEKNHFSLNNIKDLKTRQYAIEGQVLYENHCANCHQSDGTGLGRLIPPLKNADYLKADIGRTVRLIKHGIKGEIIVNGADYNKEMPANPALTNLEIAEITTYIYTAFTGQEKIIEVNKVKAFLEE